MSDLGWVERLLQAPPSCLSELERLVGRLHVDFAGDEGNGRVFRPDPRTVVRAELTRDVTFLSAGFFFDMYHDHARQQPEWALPPVAPATREDFLATLVDRLVCESTEPPIAAALTPLAAAAGAEVRSPISSDGRGLGGPVVALRRADLPEQGRLDLDPARRRVMPAARGGATGPGGGP